MKLSTIPFITITSSLLPLLTTAQGQPNINANGGAGSLIPSATTPSPSPSPSTTDAKTGAVATCIPSCSHIDSNCTLDNPPCLCTDLRSLEATIICLNDCSGEDVWLQEFAALCSGAGIQLPATFTTQDFAALGRSSQVSTATTTSSSSLIGSGTSTSRGLTTSTTSSTTQGLTSTQSTSTTTTTTPTPTTTITASTKKSSLSGGAIAGIVIGVTVPVLAIAGFLGYRLYRRRRLPDVPIVPIENDPGFKEVGGIGPDARRWQ
ncbi:hypothetical protein TWF281_001360 [Arthrobotrys megalospora]